LSHTDSKLGLGLACRAASCAAFCSKCVKCVKCVKCDNIFDNICVKAAKYDEVSDDDYNICDEVSDDDNDDFTGNDNVKVGKPFFFFFFLKYYEYDLRALINSNLVW
jgi:hypothetical protein